MSFISVLQPLLSSCITTNNDADWLRSAVAILKRFLSAGWQVEHADVPSFCLMRFVQNERRGREPLAKDEKEPRLSPLSPIPLIARRDDNRKHLHVYRLPLCFPGHVPSCIFSAVTFSLMARMQPGSPPFCRRRDVCHCTFSVFHILESANKLPNTPHLFFFLGRRVSQEIHLSPHPPTTTTSHKHERIQKQRF